MPESEHHYFMDQTTSFSYHRFQFRSSSELSESQIKKLINCFNAEPEPADSVLGGRTAVKCVQISDIGPVIIKNYTRGGLIRYMIKNTYLKIGKLRCRIEYDMLAQALAGGVSVPEPVFYAYRGSPFYRCWLGTREIQNPVSLAEMGLKDKKRIPEVMHQVIQQVSKLIKIKLFHVDLHPGNVLIDDKGNVFIVDFDKAHLSRVSENGLMIKYIKRWERAVQKHQLPDSIGVLLKTGLHEIYREQ